LAKADTLMTRKRLLSLAGATLLFHDCSAKAVNPVRIGSKNSSENSTIAEIYAVALERENMAVERHMNLGNAQNVMAAIQRGDIDLYPEYVRTGREHPRQRAPAPHAVDLYGAAKRSYEQRYGITWLTPSPANDSPCLATSQYAAEQYWLLALPKCADIASELRFAATPEFLAPSGALLRLQQFYGGFKFKTVLSFDPGEQYYALDRGDVDVASAFTTDAQIAENQLVVLADDKHFWPQYNVAPVIRLTTIHSHPRVASVVNRISRRLTQYSVQQITMRLHLLGLEPHDVAADFVTKGGP
jgi:osmoprotectant transport system substrate-binding protein